MHTCRIRGEALALPAVSAAVQVQPRPAMSAVWFAGGNALAAGGKYGKRVLLSSIRTLQ